MKLSANDCRFFGGMATGVAVVSAPSGDLFLGITATCVAVFFAWKLHNLEPKKKDP